MFKVKYDGREIPCDYKEPVLSNMSNVNKNINSGGKTYQPTYVYMSIAQIVISGNLEEPTLRGDS